MRKGWSQITRQLSLGLPSTAIFYGNFDRKVRLRGCRDGVAWPLLPRSTEHCSSFLIKGSDTKLLKVFHTPNFSADLSIKTLIYCHQV